MIKKAISSLMKRGPASCARMGWDFAWARRKLPTIMGTVDGRQFEIFRTKYAGTSPDGVTGFDKYVDVNKFLHANLMRIHRLGLHRIAGLNVLDIGAGCGYFPYLCGVFGHDALAIDLDSVEMYNKIIAFLGVRRKVQRVEPFVPLPDLGTKFDLVTAFSVKFDGHNSDTFWGPQEWRFFLHDLAVSHVSDRGRICLLLNGKRAYYPNFTLDFYTPELRRFFAETGGRIDQGLVLYRDLRFLRQLGAHA